MHLLIMNGNPSPANRAWEEWLRTFSATLAAGDGTVIVKRLANLDIKPCTGCWSCWWATPGLCSRKDDMTAVYPEILAADILVWASPLVLGNVSALTKIAQDRFIPLLHPYIEMVEGESHHRRRYRKNIDMGVILGPQPDDTEEDIRIVGRLHERLARNGRGELKFVLTTSMPPEQAAGRICASAIDSSPEEKPNQEISHETARA
jgi:hypothetical protein